MIAQRMDDKGDYTGVWFDTRTGENVPAPTGEDLWFDPSTGSYGEPPPAGTVRATDQGWERWTGAKWVKAALPPKGLRRPPRWLQGLFFLGMSFLGGWLLVGQLKWWQSVGVGLGVFGLTRRGIIPPEVGYPFLGGMVGRGPPVGTAPRGLLSRAWSVVPPGTYAGGTPLSWLNPFNYFSTAGAGRALAISRGLTAGGLVGAGVHEAVRR